MIDRGSLLKDLRIHYKYTQAEVAHKIGVSATTVLRWENNYKTPSMEHMRALAILYNVSINTIAAIEKEKVIVIDGLSKREQQLMHDLVSDFREPKHQSGISLKEKEMICELLDIFTKGE